MTLFKFLFALSAVILGLALTHLAGNVHRLLLAGRNANGLAIRDWQARLLGAARPRREAGRRASFPAVAERPMSWRRSRGINAMATRLLVRNLSFDTTKESLVDLFSAVGGMLELSMPQNRDTGQTRGLAYVAMATEGDAQAAIDRLNGHMLDGRPLRISLAPETTAPPFARSLRPN